MHKFIEIKGTLRAPAYIGDIYYMGGEKITMKIGVSDKKSLGTDVVEPDEESAKLIAATIKELAKEVKDAKEAKNAPAKKASVKAPELKINGEIPLV